MKGPDAGLRKILAEKLKLHGFWFQAIETGSTTAGVPDSHVLGPSGTLWVESKRTLSRTGRLKFEAHQIQWWRRHSMWIDGFIAVRLTDGDESDGLSLFPGSAIDELADSGAYAVKSLLTIRKPLRSWDWGTVATVFHTGTRSIAS